MNKIILSIVGILIILVGGYFVDDGYKAKVNSIFGIGQTAHVAQVNTVPQTTAVPNARPASNDALNRILSTHTITVSVQDPSKPFYYTSNGQPRGFNLDFLNLVLSQGNFRGQVLATKALPVSTYEDVPKQLLSNRSIDIAIDGLTFNNDDLPGVVYTVPYVKDFGYSLIVARGSVVQGPADLAGGRVGVLKGDPDARAFAESAFPGAKIVELSDQADASGKWIAGHIRSGTVDAVVYDYPFAVAEVEGTNLQFAIPKIKGSDIQYRIGVRAEDKDLLAALNDAIRKAVETPEYAAMLKSYFMSTNVAAVRRATASESSYVVQAGDTLSTIAQAKLGNKMRYTDIQIRNNLANPNFIAVGQKLIIPQ